MAVKVHRPIKGKLGAPQSAESFGGSFSRLNDVQQQAERQRNSSIVSIAGEAMGDKNHDVLMFSNGWAKVEIQRERIRNRSYFHCYGDCAILTFPELDSAIRYALAALTLFENGRADC